MEASENASVDSFVNIKANFVELALTEAITDCVEQTEQS